MLIWAFAHGNKFINYDDGAFEELISTPSYVFTIHIRTYVLPAKYCRSGSCSQWPRATGGIPNDNVRGLLVTLLHTHFQWL
jgi:hypothetical protein